MTVAYTGCGEVSFLYLNKIEIHSIYPDDILGIKNLLKLNFGLQLF